MRIFYSVIMCDLLKKSKILCRYLSKIFKQVPFKISRSSFLALPISQSVSSTIVIARTSVLYGENLDYKVENGTTSGISEKIIEGN